MAKKVFQLNQNRYSAYMEKIERPEQRKGEALFKVLSQSFQKS